MVNVRWMRSDIILVKRTAGGRLSQLCSLWRHDTSALAITVILNKMKDDDFRL